ncbi:MAG: hypothetical protein AB1568_10875 [Thermodesulfobacteriota bacterium]
MNTFDQMITAMQDKKGGVLGLSLQPLASVLPKQCIGLSDDLDRLASGQLYDFLAIGGEVFLLNVADRLPSLLGKILKNHGLLFLCLAIDTDSHRHTMHVSRLLQTVSSWNHFEFVARAKQPGFDIYVARFIKKLPVARVPVATSNKSIGIIIDQKLDALLTNHPLMYGILRKTYLTLQRFFPADGAG